MFVGIAVPNKRLADSRDSMGPHSLVTAECQIEVSQIAMDHYQVQCKLDPQLSKRAFAEVYALIVGMRLANLSVVCTGDLSSMLPAALEPSLSASSKVEFGKIGIDHDIKASKKFQVSPEQLTHWYHYFGSITTLAQANQAVDYPGKHMLSDHCYLWKLPEGLMIRSKVENDQLIDHQILGFTFPFNAMQKGMPLSKPSRRRTWGEAWLPHDVAVRYSPATFD